MRGYVAGLFDGRVIAAFLASFLAVDKLVLVAPAFEYMNLETVSRLIPKYAAILKQSESQFKAGMEERLLEYAYFPQFFELVKKLCKPVYGEKSDVSDADSAGHCRMNSCRCPHRSTLIITSRARRKQMVLLRGLRA